MKKVVYFLAIALFIVGCTKTEDIQQTPSYDNDTETMWKSLNGSYTTTFYVLNTESVWYWETIVFNPVEEPYSKYGYDVFGTATITKTYPSGTIYETENSYTFLKHYSKRTILFLKNSSNNNIPSDVLECNIADVTPSSFRMWHYGSSEEYNSQTYYKD